jgi:hypothetical protein
MGFRFRRRVKVLPGVHLNFSKSGISASVGRPGATINFGSKGTRTTVGIPGTGLSYSSYSRHGQSGAEGDAQESGLVFDRVASRWLMALAIASVFIGLIAAFSDNGVDFLRVGCGMSAFFAFLSLREIKGRIPIGGQDQNGLHPFRYPEKFWEIATGCMWLPFVCAFISLYFTLVAGSVGILVWVPATLVSGIASLAAADYVQGAASACLQLDEVSSQDVDLDSDGIVSATVGDLDPIEFEAVVGGLLEKMGFHVQGSPRSGDGGVDLLAIDPTPITGGRLVVQCKHTDVVGSPVIRDLYGAMQHHGASKGILVTSGRITVDAREWATGKPLELIDGDSLVVLIERYR